MSHIVLDVVLGLAVMPAASAALVLGCRNFAPLYETRTADDGGKTIEAIDRTRWAMKTASKILFAVGVGLAATASMLQLYGVTVPWP
jgi:hypothetical protein